MPPKRRKVAAAASRSGGGGAAPSTAKQRRSKLAREHDLSADEEAEIREAFGLFATEAAEAAGADDDDDDGSGVIARADVRRCLIALDAPARDRAELAELLEIVDPDETGWVGFGRFVGVAALKLHARTAAHDEDEDDEDGRRAAEVAAAFALFTRGQDRPITLADLKRVARELREDVPESVLKDMVREATGGGLGGVGVDEFGEVMRRAGALR